jgi:hypothetical protein
MAESGAPQWVPEDGEVVWAKMASYPWWPSIFFDNWDSVNDWNIALPKRKGELKPVDPDEQCVVYFLGSRIYLNVLRKDKIRRINPVGLKGDQFCKQIISNNGLKLQFATAVEEATEYLQHKPDPEQSETARGLERPEKQESCNVPGKHVNANAASLKHCH